MQSRLKIRGLLSSGAFGYFWAREEMVRENVL